MSVYSVRVELESDILAQPAIFLGGRGLVRWSPRVDDRQPGQGFYSRNVF